MVTESTTANSLEELADDPAHHERIGMNTATEARMLIETTVDPISAAPLSAASIGPRPFSMCRVMFSRTTMASSTTRSVEMGQGHQREVVDAVAKEIHDAQGSDDGHRDRDNRYMRVALSSRRKTKTTSTTSNMEMRSVASTFLTEARMVTVWSSAIVRSISGLIEAWSCGIAAFMASTVDMMLAPGWRKTMISAAGFPLARPMDRIVCTESVSLCYVREPTGAPDLYLTMIRPVVGGLQDLVVDADQPSASVRVGESALGLIGGLRGDGGAHILKLQPVVALSCVGFTSILNGGERKTSAHDDLSHTRYLRELLLEDRRGRVVERGGRELARR